MSHKLIVVILAGLVGLTSACAKEEVVYAEPVVAEPVYNKY